MVLRIRLMSAGEHFILVAWVLVQYTADEMATMKEGRWLEKRNLSMDMFAPELYYDSSPEATYMELLLPILKN